jgi:hypothetical protein
MNYLDNVFPLQFNCYVPPATELGRGWLLALLTRTKPLFHAALALSAYFMHFILKNTDPSRTSCINNHWEEMKRHHALAFKELQLQIAGLKDCGALTSTIETVAGIFQLISFEVRAANNILSTMPLLTDIIVCSSCVVALIVGKFTSLLRHRWCQTLHRISPTRLSCRRTLLTLHSASPIQQHPKPTVPHAQCVVPLAPAQYQLKEGPATIQSRAIFWSAH